MLSKLVSAAIIFGGASITNAAQTEVKLMLAEDNPEELLKEYDISVISFFKPSEPESVEIDSIFDDAIKLFNENVAK